VSVKAKATGKIFAIIRIRGRPGFPYWVQDTLKMLRLHKPQHAVLYKDTDSLRGMLQKAKDLITWGEIDAPTLALLLKKRGRLTGNKRLTEEYIKQNTKYSSFEELAEAIVKGEASIKDVPGLKPVFRLHPPRKGYKDVKHHVNEGGDLGYRGEKINDLLKQMA